MADWESGGLGRRVVASGAAMGVTAEGGCPTIHPKILQTREVSWFREAHFWEQEDGRRHSSRESMAGTHGGGFRCIGPRQSRPALPWGSRAAAIWVRSEAAAGGGEESWTSGHRQQEWGRQRTISEERRDGGAQWERRRGGGLGGRGRAESEPQAVGSRGDCRGGGGYPWK